MKRRPITGQSGAGFLPPITYTATVPPGMLVMGAREKVFTQVEQFDTFVAVMRQSGYVVQFASVFACTVSRASA